MRRCHPLFFYSTTPYSESERVGALSLRAVEVIICMITRDFSVISMTSQASLSLSLSLPVTKVTDAQYRKGFRASYKIKSFARGFIGLLIMRNLKAEAAGRGS